MRYLVHLFVFAALSCGVFASFRAAGWEAVYYYYSYRMDIESGGNTIANGCQGSHSKKGCNFAELIEYIQQETTRTIENGKEVRKGPFDRTKIPADLNLDLENPDPSKAMQITTWEGTRWTRHKPGEPDTFPSYKGLLKHGVLVKVYDNHGDLLKKIANAVQASRLKDGANTRESYRANVLTSINNVHAARVADHSESLIRDFNLVACKEFNNNGNQKDDPFYGHEKTVTPDLGDPYKTFDVEATINSIDSNTKATVSVKDKMKDRVRDYATNYQIKKNLSEPGGSNGVTHWRDITAVQDIRSALQGDPEQTCT